MQKQVLSLALLCVAAVPLFLLTRALAAKNRETNARAAVFWFQKGHGELHAGDTEAAIASFRRAALNNRDDSRYELALADALAAGHQDDEARDTLLRLRESEPEDPEINLRLARLAARGNRAEAVLYYHHALYGIWSGPHEQQDRRGIRLELIHYLIAHQDRDRALSELLALSTESTEPSPQMQAGELFLEIGDSEHAGRCFRRVLLMQPRNHAAAAALRQIEETRK